MCSIAENHCNLRQHSKGMTSSNTAASGLDLHFKDDSNLFHSIDSNHMAENVCASQEYFRWDIFLTFTYDMRKRFVAKPICEWLDNNKWTMHSPNRDTYSFFQKQEIKRDLHQSASGLFLQVCEEVSAIFIEYISNNPLISFLKIPAVFNLK